MDNSALTAAVDAAIAAQPAAWAKYCAGEEKAIGCPRRPGHEGHPGQADGKAVTALLQQRRTEATA